MWSVLEAKSLAKVLKKAPREIRESYAAWKNIVTASGPEGLKRINGYWDHALKGDWSGARASSLNQQWRVIYLIRSQKIDVLVLRVSPHDYRR